MVNTLSLYLHGVILSIRISDSSRDLLSRMPLSYLNSPLSRKCPHFLAQYFQATTPQATHADMGLTTPSPSFSQLICKLVSPIAFSLKELIHLLAVYQILSTCIAVHVFCPLSLSSLFFFILQIFKKYFLLKHS